ncbi:hypothetical protein GE061_006595 [Apolygus lucorum]|uniref:Major facilitator superfamily (MFS) profile domain-containing protein n=1 Tax=Apolygus lucorum TaxID=248454 RepID=A0A8S9WU87_APOLU|nr:hypothetical protein GE061_006595 [Apolygus lucorum]
MKHVSSAKGTNFPIYLDFEQSNELQDETLTETSSLRNNEIACKNVADCVADFDRLSPALEVSECSHPRMRGMMGSLPALAMAIGILVSYILGTFLSWYALSIASAAFPASLVVRSSSFQSRQRGSRPKEDDGGESGSRPAVLLWVSNESTIIVWSGSSCRHHRVCAACRRSRQKGSSLISGVTMAVSMAALGAYFYLLDKGKAGGLGLLPLFSQLVFIVGYSLGYCNIPFILMGELLPIAQRSLLSSVAGALNLASMFVVIKTFPDLVDIIGSDGTFWLYACLCCSQLRLRSLFPTRN